MANESLFFSPPEIPRIVLPWPPIGVSAHFAGETVHSDEENILGEAAIGYDERSTVPAE